MRPFLLAILVLGFAQIASAKKPNIILIMVDDMGWSDIGPYGAEIIQTPNLDRLAKEGLRFRQFYNNAKCTTTRASLLTGLYPRKGGRGIELLTENMLTLGEAMRLAGYQTGISGKWHNGSRAPHRPVDRGFDESYGLWDGCCNFFDPSMPDPKFKGGRVRFFGEGEKRITEFPKEFFTSDAFTDKAIAMIEKFAAKEEKPFFLYLPHTAPHYPLHAKPGDIAKYQGKFAEGWDVLHKKRHAKTVELGLIDGKWKLPEPDPEVQAWAGAPIKDWQQLRMEVYAAMIDNVDQNIGRILETLEKTGQDENTLVLFLSDNGSCAETPGGSNGDQIPGPKEYYSHCGPSWAYAQNAPFRRYKSRMHEGGIATPLIAWWPGNIPANSQTNQVGHIIDFLPTFLDIAESTYPAKHDGNDILPVEGISLLPVLKTPGESVARAKPLYWYFNGCRAIRDRKWKLAWDKKQSKWELYDMEADRTETNDLSSSHPEKTARLAEDWEAWARATGVPDKEISKGKKRKRT